MTGQHDAGQAIQETFMRVFARLDPVAFGLAVGVTAGLLLLMVTLVAVLKSGEHVRPNLNLLAQYLPGYTATIPGSFIGMIYAFAIGFIGGWGIAYLRNLTVYLSAVFIHRDVELELLRRFLDYT